MKKLRNPGVSGMRLSCMPINSYPGANFLELQNQKQATPSHKFKE